MKGPYILLAATLLFTAVAGFLHTAVSDVAGAFGAAVPLLLVAPVIAIGTDNLRGRLSPSVVGIVQSAFGNVAELALTIVALSQNLPDVVRIAIAGSLLGNAILLGGMAGLAPSLHAKGRSLLPLKFDRQLFTGIATLAVISVVPIGLLSFPVGGELNSGDRVDISLAAGIGLIILGVVFIVSELRSPHRPEEKVETPTLPAGAAYSFLAVGGVVAALTSEWFVSGFEPAVERIGIPTAFAALVIIPLLGNVAENYVALRYAYHAQGDSAMAVIMHSVIQIATLMTGILLVVSRFIGSQPLTLRYDPILALSLLLSLIVLWMILHDGQIEPVEAVGLLVTYGVLGATIWVEG